MPDTFDLENTFDDLTRDLARAAGPGDVDRTFRTVRRRRAAAGVLAMAVAVILAVTAVQVTGSDPDGAAPGYAGSGGEASPGAERRERLLALLPPDASQVSVLDVAGFTGGAGLDGEGAELRRLGGYVMASFVKLQRGFLGRLLLPDLVTYAGSGGTDVFLVDRPASEITDALGRDGWEDHDGVLTPGPDVPFLNAAVARNVAVVDDDGRALVAIAHDRDALPDLDAPNAPEPGPAAAALVDVGGAVGFAFKFEPGPCELHAVSLSTATAATMLVGPPAGTAPGDVTAEDLTAPDGVTSVDHVAADGDLVRAEVTIEGPQVPLALLQRLGLPGSGFC